MTVRQEFVNNDWDNTLELELQKVFPFGVYLTSLCLSTMHTIHWGPEGNFQTILTEHLLRVFHLCG